MPVNKHEGGNLLGIRQRLAPAQDPKKFGLTQLSGLLTFLDVSCCRPLGLSCSENNNDSLLQLIYVPYIRHESGQMKSYF